MKVSPEGGAIEYQRKYLFADEVAILGYLYELGYTKKGWRCWACERKARGSTMRWAILRGAYPPDVIFWDTEACLELLERQGLL